MEKIAMNVNGKPVQVDADPNTPLLYVLRNDLGLAGPRFGCGLGQCGACTVHMDGTAIRSCATPVSTARGTSAACSAAAVSTTRLEASRARTATRRCPTAGCS